MRHPKSIRYEGKASGVVKKIEGRYANFFRVGHNAFEFVLDFGQYYRETEEAELSIRIVTTPFYAREFLTTLKESIATYERTYGTIKKDEAL